MSPVSGCNRGPTFNFWSSNEKTRIIISNLKFDRGTRLYSQILCISIWTIRGGEVWEWVRWDLEELRLTCRTGVQPVCPNWLVYKTPEIPSYWTDEHEQRSTNLSTFPVGVACFTTLEVFTDVELAISGPTTESWTLEEDLLFLFFLFFFLDVFKREDCQKRLTETPDLVTLTVHTEESSVSWRLCNSPARERKPKSKEFGVNFL